MDCIANASPKVSVLGITDYMSTRCYESVLTRKDDPRLANVDLLFPNIEFRITPWTKKNKAINLHILLSPDADDHLVKAHEALARLTIKYKDEKYPCSREGLVRLGRAYKSGLTDDETAYREGVNQFKVDFDAFRVWWDDELWLNANALIAADTSEDDGVSGLQHDDGFSAKREELYRFSHIMLSGNPNERAFWLGEDTLPILELKNKFGSPKPCLHGCDAHSIAKLLKPEHERLCWVKADPSFEGLRQTVFEPANRVFIGPDAPQRHNQDAVIQSICVQNGNGWLVDEEIPLNPGLVAIIGEKGSGKTALADLIAFGAGEDLDSNESFLYRAREYLTGISSTLRWASNRSSFRSYPDKRNENESDVRYLAQKFVERLCSAEEIDSDLVNEVESVILSHIPDHERLGVSSFDELREIRARGLHERRHHIRGELSAMNAEIAGIDRERRGLPAKSNRIVELSEHSKRLQKQYPKVEDKVAERVLKDLDKVQSEEKTVSDKVAQLERRKQSITDISRRVRTQRDQMQSFWDVLKPQLLKVGVSEIEVNAFEPKFAGDITTPLRTLSRALDKEIESMKTPSKGEDAFLAMGDTLEELAKKRKALEQSLKLDAQKRQKLLALRQQVKAVNEEKSKLQREIAAFENEQLPRRSLLLDARSKTYLEYFELIEEERDILDQLYRPLRAALATKAAHESRLELYIRTVVDIETWASHGEDLVDFRKEGYFHNGKGRMLEEARAHLLQPWQSGNREAIDMGIKHIIGRFRETPPIKSQLRVDVELEHLADWLYSVDHIELDYGLRYEGTDLQSLSPGTKGIVLLILYLAIDQEDQRPLIIDQPDENLDNQSIYDILRGYFRQAKERRQVIIVTHNPNLVVNTDADQVIVARCLRSDDGLPRIRYFSGSLEMDYREPDTGRTIRDDVCRLLEGGREAFEMRERKYRLRESRPNQFGTD